MLYQYLADFIATVHVAYVAYVFFGLVLTLIGWRAGWGWVHNRWFRGIHLVMIVGVIIRTFFAEVCPLTTWEWALRKMGQQQGAEGTAFGRLMHDLIHPEHSVSEDIPLWIFPPIYAVFGALVLAALWLVPVRWRRRPAEAAPAQPGAAEPASLR